MNQESFKNTVFCLKDEMFRFAKRFLVSTEEAEDVVQDLMMKFWQKKEELSDINVKSYVMKSVKNECLNRLKHNNIKQGFAKAQGSKIQHHVPEDNNLKDEIIKYIHKLPEKQKVVIHLKDVEEYSITEIAEILDMQENAVRVNLMRARQKVKVQIIQLMNYEKRPLWG